ncbi:terpenoid cyclases/protein prenyltransferase alpha-alpha toroid [Fimicolochytrium jonesii]|uniref:terpenoid cyclases/protein prenyltransferase alpha-alpha toroid n=1 Tax=Fimicolochytrium jonesii TaxID=1396493 RepID=UPI0022FED765|nr:terpenoid cyclases/protein prenyltransferase alpha-alpha toroid [Fimicolochytrium jonesii]KAI8820421.1 terpenoid cyclases/protein prenyltransferase alpha-alpha toroid [Fimicolochytrium jonesii]
MGRSDPPPLRATDLTRWRLRSEDGRQTWHYLEDERAASAWPQTHADRYWLDLDMNVSTLPTARTPLESARNGLTFFSKLQCEDGHFAGAYGGPHFLTPGYIIAMYVCKQTIDEPSRIEMVRYLLNMASKEDGGWGIHTEGVSTVFGTTLNYVACRLLGVDRDHPAMIKARATLHRLGTALSVPSWGKFWLAVLGVYEYEGMNPVPPELWLLPYALPIHPGRWWIHTRMVYLPMSFIYGQRLRGEITPLLEQLREELYAQPYASIDWDAQCNNIAEAEVFYPHTRVLDGLNVICKLYEKIAPRKVRQWAVDEAWRQLEMEDKNTSFGNLASVNKPMNMLCTYFKLGPTHPSFQAHLSRCADYIWLSPQGMHFNGTDGSQVWDTAFLCQAACESQLALEPAFEPMMRQAFSFLDSQQIQHNVDNHTRCYRDKTNGAWPFSRRMQGYTVSDCTAEALKTLLYMQNNLPYMSSSSFPKITDTRFRNAVDILLPMQNADGGFPSYERRRAPTLLEKINPAEVFGDIMVEYSYPECTTAVLLGLQAFAAHDAHYRAAEITAATAQGVAYIRNTQNPDGSWFGSWAICFTYATWFAVEGLAACARESYHSSARVRNACEFLVAKQETDGGWGETYKSSETAVYHPAETSQVVHTAWAVLTLLAAKYPLGAAGGEVVERGVRLLMQRQLPTGAWAQEGIEGVFNRNAMIAYPNYKFYFPVWALGRYANAVKEQQAEGKRIEGVQSVEVGLEGLRRRKPVLVDR